MADDLRITDVRFGAPHPRGIANPETGVVPEFIDVTITVHNDGGQPLHVMADVRKILYDRPTGTLTLRLEESPPAGPDVFAPRHLFPPRFETVPPGAGMDIVVPVPADLKRMTGAGPEGVTTEQYDLRGTQHVVVSVAHAAQPFQVESSADPTTVRERLAAWGDRTELRVAPTREQSGDSRRQEDGDANPR